MSSAINRRSCCLAFEVSSENSLVYTLTGLLSLGILIPARDQENPLAPNLIFENRVVCPSFSPSNSSSECNLWGESLTSFISAPLRNVLEHPCPPPTPGWSRFEKTVNSLRCSANGSNKPNISYLSPVADGKKPWGHIP